MLTLRALGMRAGVVITLAGGLWSGRAGAQPTGPHPRIWLTPEVSQRWHALSGQSGSAVARAVTKCEAVEAQPSEWVSGQYQGFAWVEALGACLIAWRSTDLTIHRDTAVVYLRGLLNDRAVLGDAEGPGYAGGAGIVAQDSGYSMRTHGVWSALGYDWLHDALTDAERDLVHQRFTQWLAFHDDANSYQRAQPGANYHAGHVLAVTLMAIGHADEMNQRQAGSGTRLYEYVVDDMWGQVMAGGVLPRAPLGGGDWLEGWQYAPLSVASYSLGGRALVEQGVQIPWLAPWNDEVLHRYVHGLSPDDRMFVGGDTGDDTPFLDVNPLPLWGVIAGVPTEATATAARGELARLGSPSATDFQLFYEALAEAADGPSVALDRATQPTAWLAAGAGNFYGRTAFTADATWIVSQCKGTIVDHQHQNAGNVVLSRGADALLVDPGPYGSLSTLTGNAPTMSQPHFNENYRPSQAAWGEVSSGLVPQGEATRFVFTRATASNVLATRCAWDGQLRFQDTPSGTVAGARRDVVLLPGALGASLLVVDRVLTTPSWATDASPLLLRFRSAGVLAEAGGGARADATVGSSRLIIRRLAGDAVTNARPVPQGDCQTADRGKCDDGRFASSEWRAEVPGPSPFAVHILDADPAGAPEPAASAGATGPVTLIDLERESRRFVVVVSRDGTAITTYQAPAVASTHVVLDAPTGGRVTVTAAPEGTGTCRLTLSPATGTSGFENAPLVFTLDTSCVATEETSQPPVSSPGSGGAGGGATGGGGSAGAGAGAGGTGEPRVDGGAQSAAGGAGSASDAADEGPAAKGPGAEGGCGCRAASGRGSAGGFLALALAAGLCARRRRSLTRTAPG